MKEEMIKVLVKSGILRERQKDTEKIKSMMQSAEINAQVTKSVPLNEDSATLIFREIYESIRQLGDAYWWSLGYEPSNHEISLDALKELSIKNKVKLNFLSRFKQIRHDANYKGFRVSTAQAKEIIDFWDSCSKDIINIIKSKLQEKPSQEMAIEKGNIENEEDSLWEEGGFTETLGPKDMKENSKLKALKVYQTKFDKRMKTFHKRHNEDINFNCKKCNKKISSHNKDWHNGMCDDCFNKEYY